MAEISPIYASDFYKTSHKFQYPPGTEVIYSNFTPRTSRLEGVNHAVVFGIQYFIKEFLQNQFSHGFFNQPKSRVIDQYKELLDNCLGGNNDVSHWKDLHDLGYLPLEIKALPEGSLCPLRVPILTIRNTDKRFFWLTNWIESVLSNSLWHGITCATISNEYRKLVDRYAEETSTAAEFTQWQCHDFSYRGQTSNVSAACAGAAHLLSFTGTDTIEAIPFLCDYYGADYTKEIVGGSIASTEHSVMCIDGEAGEFETYKRLLTEVYPSGNVSIVSDTYNLWRVLTEYIPSLKDVILNRDGVTVIRPDSGLPEKIICGNTNEYTPQDKGVIQLLWETFGGTVNSKGYKQLNPKIGAIYGDSITLDRCMAICEGLKRRGFASTNIVFGVGSFTYQYITRDTLGLAFKTTYAEVNGEPRVVYKDPITDDGTKRSAKGLLMVVWDTDTRDYRLVEDVSPAQEQSGWNMLRTVFLNGKLTRETTLHKIRTRLHQESGVS